MQKALLEYLQTQLQADISKVQRVYGGDINQTYLLSSPKQNFFLKLNSIETTDMFEKEFKGLELLRSASSIAVPQPLLQGIFDENIFLAMVAIEKGQTLTDFWEVFGRKLAALHNNTNDHFGLDHDNYIGSLPQENKQSKSWVEFYAERRILFLIKKAFDEKKCDSSDTKKAERLCNKLGELFPTEPPALLHGDLWSGNYMVNEKGQPVIYDPAVYYGHREMDIGMSLLFGGFDKSFYSHYNNAFPLEKNWRQRIDLTQLYPHLVHLILFGGHYYSMVREPMQKYSG
jgi:fructosamine-3-kinase